MRELFELLSGDKAPAPITTKARLISIKSNGKHHVVFENGKITAAEALTDEFLKLDEWVYVSKVGNNYFIHGTVKG